MRGIPPKVIKDTSLLFELTPTSSSLPVPVPELKFASVIWFDADVEPEIDLTLFRAIPAGAFDLVTAEAAFDGMLVPAELIAETR